MNQVKQTIRTFIRFNNRTFECGKYTFVLALVCINIRPTKHGVDGMGGGRAGDGEGGG